MYCYECGSKISNYFSGLECPYCNTELLLSNQMILDNLIDKMWEKYHEADMVKETFYVGEHKITLSEKTLLKRKSYIFFKKIFNKTWIRLQDWIAATSFDNIVKERKAVQKEINESVVYASMVFIKSFGCNITYEDYLENFYDWISKADSLGEFLEECCSEFEELRAELNSYNDSSRTEYVPGWIGGGTTIKSAIIGSLKADLLNLGGAIVNEFGNATKRNINATKNTKEIIALKLKIKEQPEFIKRIKEAWQYHIEGAAQRVSKYLIDNNYAQGDFRYDYWELVNLDENITIYHMDAAVRKLNENPFDLAAYVSVYSEKYPVYGRELLELASICGIKEEVQLAFLSYRDAKLLNKLEEEKLGLGASVEKLSECKKLMDNLEENNLIYAERPELVYVQKERELAYKVASALANTAILQAQKKVEKLAMENETSEAFRIMTEEYGDYGREVLFQYYFQMLKSFRSKKKSKELDEMLGKLEEAFEKGCLDAKDVVNEFEFSKASNIVEKTKIMSNVFLLAAQGIPYALFHAGMWYINEGCRREKGMQYIKAAFKRMCPKAIVFIGTEYVAGKVLEYDEATMKPYLEIAEYFGEKDAGTLLKNMK
ncbi:MAG: hypothetical protein J6J42_02710 [Lachnospiraceae bacterium]|nr:hypothetical protein [Lachnospiraceae bacterium]